MVATKYKDMLQEKSVIRELFGYALNRAKEVGYDNVFDYSLGNPSVEPPKEFTKTLLRLIKEMDPMALHGYSPTLGIPSVLEKVAESLRQRFALPYKAEHIFMTTGAAGAIAHTVRAVCTPGEEIITFAPFFPEYRPYITLSGAILKIVPPDYDVFQIRFDLFEEMINDKTAAVLINTPNNPTGVIYSEETLKKLATILTQKSKQFGHPIYLISDEPYREIVFGGIPAPYVSTYYKDTIVCYSFSKSLSLPGERIGYVAVNPNCEQGETIIQMCGQISRGIGHNCPPSLIQLAVAETIMLTSDLSIYEKNKNILYQELKTLGFTCVEPDGTFYIFPKALEEDANLFSLKAKKYDLCLVPGDSFGCPGYFRMAYCIETEKVERSLEAIRTFVKKEYNR